jgi:hypothetical protein
MPLKGKGLAVVESSTVGIDGKSFKSRVVSFPNKTSLYTSRINISNDIARVVTYVNYEENVFLSDILFSEAEVEDSKWIFKKILESRIDKLAILVKALNETYIDEVPLLLEDFPNIVETLFIRSRIFRKI